MRIEKIKFLNFGPFRGEHEIVFPGEGSGVQLIRGDNGQGKTSIQRGVLWNLYGKVVDRKGQEIRPTSIVNRAAASEDLYQLGVIVHFNHEGQKWSISRKMQATSDSDKKYQAGMALTVVCDGEAQPNPEQVIRRILPEDVSRFFFFDGEMLRDYEELLDQTSHSMALLRDSIEHVLGIPYLRTARSDLEEVQKKLEAERSRLLRRLGGKDYEEMVEDFQAISAHIDERQRRIKEIHTQTDRLRVEIAEKKRRLADIESVRRLAQERIKLDAEIAGLQADKERELEAMRRLTSQFHKTILAKPAEGVIARLQQKHEALMNKYNQKQQFIGQQRQMEQAIAAQKCRLCGTVLNPTVLTGLQSELEEIKLRIQDLTEIPEPNLEYENHVNRLKQAMAQAPSRDKFAEIESRIFDFDHRLAAANARLGEIRERLVSVDEDEPRRLSIDIENLTIEVGRLEGIKESEEKGVRDDLEIKAELDRRIASINQDELKTLAKRIDLVRSLAGVFNAAISVYRDERRTEVEAAATEIFKEIRTKESFARLQINSNFGMNIVTEEGVILDRAEWRSAGEEQIVALALVAALNRCAQIKAPVFMDTPFGRLDTKHGKRVLTYLPKFSEQVVLLVTDREFRKGDEAYLEGSIRSDHTVVHRSEKKGSIIFPTMSSGGSP